MKKFIFILFGILLVSCSKNNPIEQYAKDNNIELYTQSVDTVYCNIDSIDYYYQLVTDKTRELIDKVHKNIDLPDDSIEAYNEYIMIEPSTYGKPNSLLYKGWDTEGNLHYVYALYDGRIISDKMYYQTYASFSEMQTNLAKFIADLINEGV